jgi:hypothetical protein
MCPAACGHNSVDAHFQGHSDSDAPETCESRLDVRSARIYSRLFQTAPAHPKIGFRRSIGNFTSLIIMCNPLARTNHIFQSVLLGLFFFALPLHDSIRWQTDRVRMSSLLLSCAEFTALNLSWITVFARPENLTHAPMYLPQCLIPQTRRLQDSCKRSIEELDIFALNLKSPMNSFSHFSRNKKQPKTSF